MGRMGKRTNYESLEQAIAHWRKAQRTTKSFATLFHSVIPLIAAPESLSKYTRDSRNPGAWKSGTMFEV